MKKLWDISTSKVDQILREFIFGNAFIDAFIGVYYDALYNVLVSSLYLPGFMKNGLANICNNSFNFPYLSFFTVLFAYVVFLLLLLLFCGQRFVQKCLQREFREFTFFVPLPPLPPQRLFFRPYPEFSVLTASQKNLSSVLRWADCALKTKNQFSTRKIGCRSSFSGFLALNLSLCHLGNFFSTNQKCILPGLCSHRSSVWYFRHHSSEVIL